MAKNKKTGLTPKQTKFCHVYVETGNASEAYRQAYEASNMAIDTIKANAYKQLQLTYVQDYIEQLQQEAKEKAVFSIEQAHKQYLEAIEIAKNIEQPATIVTATKAQCELYGVEKPKKVEADININASPSLDRLSEILGKVNTD